MLHDPHQTKHSAYVLYSPVFFGLSYKAISHSSRDRSQSLVAIIFAALALEAFLNELAHTAEEDAAPSAETVALARALGGRAKYSPGPRARIEAIAAVLPNDSDCENWPGAVLDADILYQLRNGLAHHKVELHAWRSDAEPYMAPEHHLLQALHARGVISDPRYRGAVPWLDLVQTRRVAIWAYNAAAQMMTEIVRRLPESVFAIKMRYAVESVPLFKPNV